MVSCQGCQRRSPWLFTHCEIKTSRRCGEAGRRGEKHAQKLVAGVCQAKVAQMGKAPPGAGQDCFRLEASRRRPGRSKSQVCASAGGCPAWGTWGVTFSPSASSTQLQAGAVPGGIHGTSGPQPGSQVCLAGDAGIAPHRRGARLPAPHPPPLHR